MSSPSDTEPVGDDVDAPVPEDFEHLPSSDIDVEIRVGFGMTGSFPLKLADLFFAADGLYVVEYEYLTPIFGLGAKKHQRESAAMERLYEVHGIDEVLLQGDTVIWHTYENLERVTLHDGGRFGRPRIGVYPTTGSSHAYRLHDRETGDIETLGGKLQQHLSQTDIAFEDASGLGYQFRESIDRFFN